MPTQHSLPVVEHVDLQRYLGRWYEIARLPMWAEDEGASDVTAEYSLNEDGSVRVVNRCINEDGEVEEADGRAEVVDVTSNAKLEVSFLPKGLRWIPFAKGDYWILRLDPGYRVSLVGTPDRKYLWLLSRSTQLDGRTQLDFLEYAQTLGFTLDRLIMADQSGAVAENRPG